MRGLGISTLMVGFLLCLAGHASADTGSFSIDKFSYGYEPSGLPIVAMTLHNESAKAESPIVSVTLKEAVSNNQDAYKYRKRSATKPMTVGMIAPGTSRIVSVPVDKLLNDGNYEALVAIEDHGVRSQERFEFSVSEADVQTAKLQLQSNHLEGFGGHPNTDRRMWLTVSILAILVIGLSVSIIALKTKRSAHSGK